MQIPLSVEAPLLRYHGGKWRMADDIIALMPRHQRYVEAFGGGASVLIRKSRAPGGEIYNDLDREVSNLFSVLRDDNLTDELVRQVALTPYSRDEFEAAYQPHLDPVERARRTLIRAYMGFGTDGAVGAPSGFRVDLADAAPARIWASVPDRIAAVAARFTDVIIENRNALEVIENNDDKEVLFYIDPPYVTSTRTKQSTLKGYRHEMSDKDHTALLDCLLAAQGKVVVSGYRNKLYDRALASWRCYEFASTANRGAKRVETVWLSPNCEELQGRLL